MRPGKPDINMPIGPIFTWKMGPIGVYGLRVGVWVLPAVHALRRDRYSPQKVNRPLSMSSS